MTADKKILLFKQIRDRIKSRENLAWCPWLRIVPAGAVTSTQMAKRSVFKDSVGYEELQFKYARSSNEQNRYDETKVELGCGSYN